MQLTTNTRPFIHAEQYSSFILTNLHDGLLPETFYRNVTDFGMGDTLHIKTIGDVRIQDASADTPLEYSPIDTGEVTLVIDDYVGDAWFVSDDLYEDGAQIDSLMAQRASESTRAMQERFETKFLKVCNESQTDADPNTINGFKHRVASTEANNVLSLQQLIDIKLAFDKAEVPYGARVAIMDPVCAATLDGLVNIQSDTTPFAASIIENGFDRDHEFLMKLYGWHIITSNRLDQGTFSDGTTTVSGGVANVFMSVMDDNTKPIMMAWRRLPKLEGDRNVQLRREEYQVTSRYGFGPQRLDSLAILITSATSS